MDFSEDLLSVLYESFLVNIDEEIEIKTMSSDNLEGFFVLFLLHFVFNLIDHDDFRVDSLKVSSWELENYSSFGASNDFRSSLDISDIQELFLFQLFHSLGELNCI